MEVVKCWKCELPSVITIQASGFFCSDCFVEYFRQKYRKTIGASKLIRKGDLVVFAFDGSASGSAMLNVISTFQRNFEKVNSENKSYQKKNRYITKALHITDECDKNVKAMLESSGVEYELFAPTEEMKEKCKKQCFKIERFGDETEIEFNRKSAKMELIVEKAKEMEAQFLMLSSSVESLAAKTLSVVSLGLGEEIQATAGLCHTYNGLRILKPFREMTKKEIDFYVNATGGVVTEKKTEKQIKSIQSLAAQFLSDLNEQGKDSNPIAIVRLSNKLKLKS